MNASDEALGLVDQCVDKEHPMVIRRQLSQQVDKLLREHVSPALIGEALREWDLRPDAGPPLLPHLISTVIKRRRAQQRQDERRSSMTNWEDKLRQEMNE